MRGKWIYYVKCTDGDAEDFDAGQLEYAYRLALDPCWCKGLSFQDERRSGGVSLNGTSNIGPRWRNFDSSQIFSPVIRRYELEEKKKGINIYFL